MHKSILYADQFSLIARSEGGIAIAQLRPDAVTEVRFYARGNLAAAPLVATVPPWALDFLHTADGVGRALPVPHP